jgi:glyoxylase-like metal-dependent hydrolase (beta-lactamase superfamily II)
MCEAFSAERDERIEDTDALFEEHGVPAELRAHQREARLRWAREDPLCDATRVDRVLHHGDRVPFKDFSLDVLHAPGHTAGHVLLHHEATGTLLTGDHLMGNAVPFTDQFYLDAAPDPRDPCGRRPRFRGLPLYLRGLRALRGGGFRRILPAHGGIIERPSRAIDDALLFYEVRVQRVERALRRLAAQGQAASAWQIWEALFPKVDPVTQMRTRMYMVIGALDVLEESGVATLRRSAGGALEFVPTGA